MFQTAHHPHPETLTIEVGLVRKPSSLDGKPSGRHPLWWKPFGLR